MILAALTLAFLLQDEPEMLKVDSTWDGELSDVEPLQHAPQVDAQTGSRGIAGRAFTLEVAAGVACTIEMWSAVVDTYLIVRDSDGGLIGEDNDGLGGLNAQVVIPSRDQPTRCVVLACRRSSRNRAPMSRRRLSSSERTTRCMRARWHRLADVLVEQREVRAAIECYERALAIREKLFGPRSKEVARSRNNLGAGPPRHPSAWDALPVARLAASPPGRPREVGRGVHATSRAA
ncbi:MAG: tetratricopeptide repeat protein [Planctomycetes bacterium]|nr:tetratricopeptide repeat protein [Planctomycetota bacterium]